MTTARLCTMDRSPLMSTHHVFVAKASVDEGDSSKALGLLTRRALVEADVVHGGVAKRVLLERGGSSLRLPMVWRPISSFATKATVKSYHTLGQKLIPSNSRSAYSVSWHGGEDYMLVAGGENLMLTAVRCASALNLLHTALYFGKNQQTDSAQADIDMQGVHSRIDDINNYTFDARDGLPQELIGKYYLLAGLLMSEPHKNYVLAATVLAHLVELLKTHGQTEEIPEALDNIAMFLGATDERYFEALAAQIKPRVTPADVIDEESPFDDVVLQPIVYGSGEIAVALDAK